MRYISYFAHASSNPADTGEVLSSLNHNPVVSSYMCSACENADASLDSTVIERIYLPKPDQWDPLVIGAYSPVSPQRCSHMATLQK